MSTFTSAGNGRLPRPGTRLPLILTIGAVIAAGSAVAQPAPAPEQLIVVGERVYPIVDSVEPAFEDAVDTAELLRQLPGANLNANGMLTGIAQYRGLYGDRVAVSIDGTGMLTGGPNAMDTPLSYASPLLLDRLSIERGIASVSSATESLGGHIVADHDRGSHGDGNEFAFTGKARAGYADNGRRSTTAAQLVGANDVHKFALLGQLDRADDFEFPDGTLYPTRLDRERYDLSYAFRGEDTRALLYAGALRTTDTGTPSLPMDIRLIDTDLSGIDVETAVGSGTTLRVMLADSNIVHVMDNFGLRTAPASPTSYRSTLARGDGRRWRIGSETATSKGSWQLGLDGESAAHTAAITNPNAAAFRIANFNDATRDITGIYAQANQAVGRYDIEAGLRYNRIDTNAGPVAANIPAMTPTMQMMATAAGAMADAFNAADRSRTHDNVDVVFKLGRTLGETRNVYVELARKTRAPSYQELYLWLPLEATGGLADGRSYIGDPALRSEVSREINFGSNWQSGRAWIAPQVFYKDIEDYIQGTPTTNATANMVAMMMTGNPALGFTNTDAKIYGIDVAWGYYLTDRLTVTGTLTRARGRRTDVDDDLYRLAPLNGVIALGYASADDWQLRLEAVAYDAQEDVSAYNGEARTAGYGIVNASGQWQIRRGLSLTAHVSNLFDKRYRDHLDGINRVMDADLAAGQRLAGIGRSLQIGVRYAW